MNLAANARDAMRGGGELTIRTGTLTVDDGQASPWLEPGRYVTLDVVDTGTGISDELREHLFEPFFTTKEVGGGTGLGLSTVLGIVEQNGGRIAADSEEGSDTAFRITLPRRDAPAPDIEALVAAPTPNRAQLLVVEDNPAVRQLTNEILVSAGYHVLTASTPEEALADHASRPGAIDLLVTDVVMPEMNGLELARRMRAQNPRLAALFVSGYPAETAVVNGVLPAGMVFLQKPFAAAELVAKVEEALATSAR